jgi:hypothetical protein
MLSGLWKILSITSVGLLVSIHAAGRAKAALDVQGNVNVDVLAL